MSKAKITKKDGYKCAPKGSIVVLFECGETVDGQVADWACKDGAAKRLFEKKLKPEINNKKLTPKMENKGRKYAS